MTAKIVAKRDDCRMYEWKRAFICFFHFLFSSIYSMSFD